MSTQTTAELQSCIERLQRGDETARDELVTRACKRMEKLTRTMLRGYPHLQRWQDTDDVFQGATLRLCKALRQMTPASAEHFLHLAAVAIRRELVDLARHYFGPQGTAAFHATPAEGLAGDTPAGREAPASTHDPGKLAVWTELHEQIASLPDEEREVFDLLWYHGLTQADAAAMLGVSERTILRRWQSARLHLMENLQYDLPGM
jgi:RNA polymerase sigma-70 factor (ECF subfamily)